MDISARFADSDEVEALKGREYKQYPNEIGSTLLAPVSVNAAETVTLGLSRFFKTITIQGLRMN